MRTIKHMPCKISNLVRGDIVIHKASGSSYVVTANYGSYSIAVESVHITNGSEWSVLTISDDNE